MKGKVRPEVIAFSLQILTDVVVFFSFSFRMAAEIENNFTSAQRIRPIHSFGAFSSHLKNKQL